VIARQHGLEDPKVGSGKNIMAGGAACTRRGARRDERRPPAQCTGGAFGGEPGAHRGSTRADLFVDVKAATIFIPLIVFPRMRTLTTFADFP
jgi:hypothetical protein